MGEASAPQSVVGASSNHSAADDGGRDSGPLLLAMPPHSPLSIVKSAPANECFASSLPSRRACAALKSVHLARSQSPARSLGLSTDVCQSEVSDGRRDDDEEEEEEEEESNEEESEEEDSDEDESDDDDERV